MKKIWSLGVMCAFLLAVSPAQANITAFLEEPAQGPVSGIGNIRGWAFATNEDGQLIPVTIRTRLDGVTQDTGLTCCVPRQDVQNANPGAPLETGFSGQTNYGLFSEGTHTIGVEVTAGGARVIIDNSVRVVKLGGNEFATGIDLTNASVSLDGDAIVISNATVSNSTDVVDNLRLEFGSASQSFSTTDSTVSGGTNVTSFVANLNVDQEIPAPIGFTASNVFGGVPITPSTGSDPSGSAFLTLNGDMSLTYRVVVPAEGLSSSPVLLGPEEVASAAHIHQAGAGTTGDIIIFLTFVEGSGDPSFIWDGTSDPLTGEQQTALLNGELYVNVHTETNAPGEIRGQIVAAGGPGPCVDTTREIFVVAAPASPWAQLPTPDQGCRLLNEALCGLGWQYIAGSSAAGPVSCTYFPDFNVCAACGPNLQAMEACTNTCVAQ